MPTKPVVSKQFPPVFVNVDKLSARQIKSLQLLQSHFGKRNLVLEARFSRCYAENMHKQSQTAKQTNIYATFGGENAVPAPQNVIFAQQTDKKAAPKIAENNWPNVFKAPSKYHKASAHQR